MFSSTYTVFTIIAAIIFICYIVYLEFDFRKTKKAFARAAFEHQLITDNILRAETAIDYHYWRVQATDFCTKYQNLLPPALIKTYWQVFVISFDLRMKKGFEK